MGQSVHPGIPVVVTKSLRFQTPNSVGLAKAVNGIINSFSITYTILYLANKSVVHHEATTLVTLVFNLARVVSAASMYV
jgi:hypothetical protein